MTTASPRPVPGLYIHVPFCASKCPYCDFYSVASDSAHMEAYVSQTCRLLRRIPQEFPWFHPDTLYLGGGTPSLLGEERLLQILDTAVSVLHLPQNAEITLEANPGTVTLPMLRALRRGGYNRISFGVQSAVEEELRFLGRRHSAQESEKAVQWAFDAGFSRISLDLMLGLAGQTEESLERSLDFCARTPADHVSAYLLKIEPNTLFYRRGVGSLCPDEDGQAALYLAAAEGLEKRGFHQYEISNFARNGQYAVHNLKYWDGAEYLGVGPGAHSFWEGRRYSIPRDLKGYLSAEGLKELFSDEGEGGGLEEYLMLRLRLREGIAARKLRERFPQADCWEALCGKAKSFQEAGYLEMSPDPERGFIGFTAKGFLVSNALIGELLAE